MLPINRRTAISGATLVAASAFAPNAAASEDVSPPLKEMITRYLTALSAYREAYRRFDAIVEALGGAEVAFAASRHAPAESQTQGERNRAAGLHVAETRLDELLRPVSDAWEALIPMPCRTLGDVRAKAAAVLTDNSWSELEYDECRILLRSFLAADAA